MSTLSLDDLGPKVRRSLGLESGCVCAGRRTGFVASIPVFETHGPAIDEPVIGALPGAAWIETGLHQLRVSEIQLPVTADLKRSGNCR